MTLIIGWPVLGYPRLYEDLNAPTMAVPWQGLRAEMGNWTRKPQRMITTMSFQATEALGGDTRVDHAVNLAGIVLTVAVAAHLPSAAWGMVLAGALIGWHPLQTEGLAYLSARADVFVGLALAGGLLAIERRRWWLAVIAAVAAFASKESGVMVAPLLVLWAFWRGLATWRLVLACSVAFGLGAGWLALRYPLQPSLVPIGQVGTLLGQLVWPVGLTIDYDWSRYTVSTGVLTLLWGVALMAVACAFGRPTLALCLVGLGVWFLPRVLVPLSEGLHAHHVTGVMPWIAVCLTYPQKV